MGSAYWPDLSDAEIREFEVQLEEIGLHFNNKIIVGGDFNSRIGCLNAVEDDILEGTSLSPVRYSPDVVNPRGSKLTDIMEGAGLMVCNGRSRSDTPANYTFVGHQGSSVIDLVWINSLCVESFTDFEVKFLSSCSDHLLTVLHLNFTNNPCTHSCQREFKLSIIVRNPQNFFLFNKYLHTSSSIYFISNSVDDLYSNFLGTILEGMQASEMTKTIKRTSERHGPNKPWFSKECSQAKRRNGATGISLDSHNELLILLYADDMVILSWSWADAQKKLDILQKYCEINGLEVNVNKTVVVPFYKGKLGKVKDFYYKDNKITMCNSFNYLGVQFSSSGKFSKAANNFVTKGKMATASVMKILAGGKCNSWESIDRIFDAMAVSVVLYCSEVWGPDYVHLIERVQLHFLKCLFNLPRCTPDHYVRTETCRLHLKYKVFNQMLGWWVKVLSMDDTRLPRICYESLCKFSGNKNIPFNWVDSLKRELNSVGALHVWDSQNPLIIKKEIKNLKCAMSGYLMGVDAERVAGSGYSTLYRHVCGFFSPNPLLSSGCDIGMLRVILQVRLSSHRCVIIRHKGSKYELRANITCPLCNSELENICHYLFHCKSIEGLRNKYISQYMRDQPQVTDTNKFASLFEYRDITKLKNIYLFILECMREKYLSH